MTRIYLSPPDVGRGEEDAVVAALRSGWVAPLGPELHAFEEEIARLCGRQHAVGLSSGTAALHLGLLALGVTEGDVVATSTLTFAATVNAIHYVGARPLFVDCDETGNMSPELLERALATASTTASPLRAVLPVDLMGKVAPYERILPIAQAFGLPTFSDAAESLGAQRDDVAAGSFGTVAALSFNGNKILTTSGGGMLVTDDEQIARRTRHLATQAREPAVHYEHREVGYNYRLSNVLAALGRAQLARLPQMVTRRRDIRAAYRAYFAEVPGVEIFGGADDAGDNCWLTAIVVDPELPWGPEDLRLALEAADIESRPMWKPMHRQPVFAGSEAVIDGTSDRLFAQSLTLPSGSSLTASDLDRVLSVIGDVVESR